MRFGTNVTALSKTDTGIAASLTDGSVEEYDVVMFATGRKPRTAELNCDLAGVSRAGDIRSASARCACAVLFGPYVGG